MTARLPRAGTKLGSSLKHALEKLAALGDIAGGEIGVAQIVEGCNEIWIV